MSFRVCLAEAASSSGRVINGETRVKIVNPRVQSVSANRSAQCFLNRRSNSRRSLIHPRALNDAEIAGEWSSLAYGENEEEADNEYLNQVCSKALKAMLQGSMVDIGDVQEELFTVGEFYSNQKKHDAALFIFVLLKLTHNLIPEQEASLTGKYRDAFLRVFGLLEDSGWDLVREGEEDEKQNEEPMMGNSMYG